MDLLLENKDSSLEIKDSINSLLYDDYNLVKKENSNECTICCNQMRNPIKLNCQHTFCRECLLQSFKGSKCNFYIKNHRICPYCRSPSNYLTLEEDEVPIKGIHKEYGKGNIFKLCKAIIKSGPKSGQSCKCKVKGGGDVCGRHKKTLKK
jgi:hypothetical protein